MTPLPADQHSRQLRFNLFEMGTVSHINHGLWTHPDNSRHHYDSVGFWIETARLAERGLFDSIFLADVLGTYDVYGGSRDAAVERGIQIPSLDPMLIIPAMAAETAEIGFTATVSTTYEPPFGNARRFSTLDLLTNGRVGWNVVTGYLPNAARNFGIENRIGHDDRYDVADEYLEVSYKLWEHSWADGAMLRDTATGRYVDAALVRDINHSGRFFTVDGPHLSEPSRQRTPMLFQAGASGRGKIFAATHGEGLFLRPRSLAAAATTRREIIELAEERGRAATDLAFFVGIDVIVAETEAEVKKKAEDILAHRDLKGYLVHFGGGTGIDLAALGAEEYLRFKGGDHIQSKEAEFANKKATDVIDQLSDPAADAFLVIGTPEQVADRIEQIAEETGCEGFNLVQYLSPGTLRDFVELVVPVLQSRGRYRTSYVPGQTLRERLIPGSGALLPSTHPAAQYR